MLQLMYPYPGGKGGAGTLQTIINLQPPHEVYIEPFLGGASVMRAKLPASLNIGMDLDAVAVFAVNHEIAGRIAWNGGARSPDMARSADTAGNGDRRRRETPGSAIRYRIEEGDGIALLETYQFTGKELVYCDPPYLHSTRKDLKLYQHEMTDVDHRRLLRVIRKIPAMVMISGYSSTLYAKELKGWNATAYQSSTRQGPAAEWIWYNFPRPTALHDYRFLGNDFRERERIRRQQKRWKARLERMDVLQRQALLSTIASIAGFNEATRSV